jgi:hypothetical protein
MISEKNDRIADCELRTTNLNTQSAVKGPSNQSVWRITKINLFLVGIGAVLFGIFQGLPSLFSFLAGGLLTVANLWFLNRIVSKLTYEEDVSKGRLIAQVLIKYLGMIGAIAFLMLVIHPSAIPFLVGLSTLVLAIMVEGVRGIFN